MYLLNDLVVYLFNYVFTYVCINLCTGFSYVESKDAFAETDDEILIDLVTCIREFYEKFPECDSVPVYIASQSYGTKIAAKLALHWHQVDICEINALLYFPNFYDYSQFNVGQYN